MYLKYGNKQCQTNEVAVSLQRDMEFVNGIAARYNEIWQLNGRVHAADQASLSTEMASLEAAFLLQGQDLVFYFDSGSASQHALYSNQCIGGTRVTQPVSYSEGRGAQYTTYRDWTATVEGTVLRSNFNLIEFGESLEIIEGGPEVGFLPTINGPPPKQLLRQQTTSTAVQQGFAVGLRSYPIVPPPLFPFDEHRNRRRIRRETPQRFGAPGRAQYTEYRVSWLYEFESSYMFPQVAPSLWSE